MSPVKNAESKMQTRARDTLTNTEQLWASTDFPKPSSSLTAMCDFNIFLHMKPLCAIPPPLLHLLPLTTLYLWSWKTNVFLLHLLLLASAHLWVQPLLRPLLFPPPQHPSLSLLFIPLPFPSLDPRALFCASPSLFALSFLSLSACLPLVNAFSPPSWHF